MLTDNRGNAFYSTMRLANHYGISISFARRWIGTYRRRFFHDRIMLRNQTSVTVYHDGEKFLISGFPVNFEHDAAAAIRSMVSGRPPRELIYEALRNAEIPRVITWP